MRGSGMRGSAVYCGACWARGDEYCAEPAGSAKSSDHERVKQRLGRFLNLALPHEQGVFVEAEIAFGSSDLHEPDLSVWPAEIGSQDVRGPDLLLLIEVAVARQGAALRQLRRARLLGGRRNPQDDPRPSRAGSRELYPGRGIRGARPRRCFAPSQRERLPGGDRRTRGAAVVSRRASGRRSAHPPPRPTASPPRTN